MSNKFIGFKSCKEEFSQNRKVANPFFIEENDVLDATLDFLLHGGSKNEDDGKFSYKPSKK